MHQTRVTSTSKRASTHCATCWTGQCPHHGRTTATTAAKPPGIFSKRHYEWFAEYHRNRKAYKEHNEWLTGVMRTASMLKAENDKFIAVRFMQACGMTRGEANRALRGQCDE